MEKYYLDSHTQLPIDWGIKISIQIDLILILFRSDRTKEISCQLAQCTREDIFRWDNILSRRSVNQFTFRILDVISTDLRDLIESCLLRLYVVLLSLGNLSLPVTVTTTRDLTASMLGILPCNNYSPSTWRSI